MPNHCYNRVRLYSENEQDIKKLHEIFQEKYANDESKINTSAVILHDIGSKEERKNWVEDFKDGKIDILFVSMRYIFQIAN